MAYALKFDGVDDYLLLTSPVALLFSDFNERLVFYYDGSGNPYALIANPLTNNDVIRITNTTTVLFKAGSVSKNLTLLTPLTEGWHTWRIKRESGVVDVTDDFGTSLLVSTVSNGNSFTMYGFGKIAAGNNFSGMLSSWRHYSDAQGTVLVNDWDATASDHSGSTDQPELLDTIGGNNAIGSGFLSFDTSVWENLGGGGLSVDLDPGAISLSGSSVSLEKHNQITLEQGALSYQGQALDLVYGTITSYEIDPEQGVISLIGNNITLNRTYQLILESGSLTYQGNPVSLTYAQAGSYDIDIDTGTLNLSGSDILFGFGKEISIDSGLISLSGADLTFNKVSEIDLDAGSLSLTGGALTLDYSGFVSVIVDDFTLAYSSDTIGLSYTANGITLNYK